MEMTMSSSGTMEMVNVFHNSMTDPLYSAHWTPNSAGSYAGTVVFLILMGSSWRALFALRAVLERRWADRMLNRRAIIVAGRQSESERISGDPNSKSGTLVTVEGKEDIKIVKRHVRGALPWRFSMDLPRALLVVVISGIGYLL
jgi:hypothetical protein